jgi:hypothetical protein
MKCYWNGYLLVKTLAGKKTHIVITRDDPARSVALCGRRFDTTHEAGLDYPGKSRTCRNCQWKFDHPEL